MAGCFKCGTKKPKDEKFCDYCRPLETKKKS